MLSYFVSLCECGAHMHVCVLMYAWCLQNSEEFRISETGVVVGCKLPCGFCEFSLGSLQK